MNDIQRSVEEFISRFTLGGRYTQVIEAMSCGCCYWFAYILAGRFQDHAPEIVYDIVANHFGTLIRGKVYDITGDVTDKYTWLDWSSMTENDCAKERVIEGSILF